MLNEMFSIKFSPKVYEKKIIKDNICKIFSIMQKFMGKVYADYLVYH